MQLRLILSCVIGFAAYAQAPPEPKYGYEVASIKKSDPAARGAGFSPGAQGGLKTKNTNLVMLLAFAYDVRDYQIINPPGWANRDGFDISFTPDKPETFPKPGEATADSMETRMGRQRQRLQAILRDRFGVKLRIETRELPVYALSLAKNGSKLKPPADSAKGPSMMMNGRSGELTGTAANMRMLTNVLSNIMKQPVVDNTGILGTFDLKLQWKPDGFAAKGDGPPGGDAPPVADVDGPSIFTAITEQLGLKLESKKGPVTVYVVEKAELPSDN